MRRWLAGWKGLLLSTLLLQGCAQNLFYYPNNIVYSNPADYGLTFERVIFSSRDGTLLTGWFFPAQNVALPRLSKGTVIHFHGNAQNISSHWRMVGWLPSAGFNVLVFDYRGYGNSAGKPDPKGIFEDSLSAIDYVVSRQDVDAQKLFVFGQSLGGNNAISAVGALQREREINSINDTTARIRAVAVESPFFSYASIADDKLIGAGWLMNDDYSARHYVADIAPIPLLLIHGDADPVISHRHSEHLLQAAKGDKTLIIVPGGGHIEVFVAGRFGSTYRKILVDFFERALQLAAP